MRRAKTGRMIILIIAYLFIHVYLCYQAFNNIKITRVHRLGMTYLNVVLNDQDRASFNYSHFSSENQERANLKSFVFGITPFTTKPFKGLNVTVRTTDTRRRPLLTLFTTWTEQADRYHVHNLTIKNWLSLRPHVIPVVFTNATRIADECRRRGLDVFPVRVAAANGIPVLKFMFEDVMSTYNTTFYGYSNSDILYSNSLVETLTWISNASVDLKKPVMIVGKRTNVIYVKENDTTSWTKLHAVATRRGKLFVGRAEDYFITSRPYPWKDIAEVVIGRPAYDNWLVYNARTYNHTVIDATKTLLAVHQTTRAGNIEGSFRKNSSYNRDLLLNMYKHVNFDAGVTDCIELYTDYRKKAFVIAKRTLPVYCSL